MQEVAAKLHGISNAYLGGNWRSAYVASAALLHYLPV
jgi:hypothetical protein